MVNRIFIARHGETLWNRQGRMQGQQDSALTDRGRAQAEQLKEHLMCNPTIQSQGICAAYSSNLGRAKETLAICLKGTTVPSYALNELNEICLGDWEGLTFQEVEQRWPEQFHNFWHHPSRYVPAGNGETFLQLQQRVIKALKKIMQRHHGENILVISHWMAIKTAIAYFKGMDIDHIPSIPKPDNGEYNILSICSQNTTSTMLSGS